VAALATFIKRVIVLYIFCIFNLIIRHWFLPLRLDFIQ